MAIIYPYSYLLLIIIVNILLFYTPNIPTTNVIYEYLFEWNYSAYECESDLCSLEFALLKPTRHFLVTIMFNLV